jgi:hypothetical protein
MSKYPMASDVVKAEIAAMDYEQLMDLKNLINARINNISREAFEQKLREYFAEHMNVTDVVVVTEYGADDDGSYYQPSISVTANSCVELDEPNNEGDEIVTEDEDIADEFSQVDLVELFSDEPDEWPAKQWSYSRNFENFNDCVMHVQKRDMEWHLLD